MCEKTKIEVVMGDITDENCDAIVNAANTSLLAGGGVCGAIFAKAGYNELQRACNELSPIKTGEAVATPGFNLKAKYIIHTAGPIYRDNSSAPLLRNSYINSLKVAEELKLESIAFPSISTGIYGYPLDEAAKIAIDALTSFENSSLKVVKMVCFDKFTYDKYERELSRVDNKKESRYSHIDNDYNYFVKNFKENLRLLNGYVMDNTLEMCNNDKELICAIRRSKEQQYIIYHNDVLNIKEDRPTIDITVSRKRSFEAAGEYKGKKIALLNFANNHSVGGAPWRAGAQEESLCRCSTLYPCILDKKEDFYLLHSKLYNEGKLDDYGNDDLIYTPGVVVIKSDESRPLLLDNDERYYADIITCAAPELCCIDYDIHKYEVIMRSRIKRILEVAKKEKVEVLILGAFGCGAFHNPPEVVARLFKEELHHYHFNKVEFAVYCREESPSDNYNVFKRIIYN